MIKNFYEDISQEELLTKLAMNGYSDSMLKLVFHILINSEEKEKVLKVYKWLFLAEFVGNTKANDIMMFVRSNMTQKQIDDAELLVDKWCSDKQAEYERNETSEWDKSLLKMWTDASHSNKLN